MHVHTFVHELCSPNYSHISFQHWPYVLSVLPGRVVNGWHLPLLIIQVKSLYIRWITAPITLPGVTELAPEVAEFFTLLQMDCVPSCLLCTINTLPGVTELTPEVAQFFTLDCVPSCLLCTIKATIRFTFPGIMFGISTVAKYDWSL